MLQFYVALCSVFDFNSSLFLVLSVSPFGFRAISDQFNHRFLRHKLAIPPVLTEQNVLHSCLVLAYDGVTRPYWSAKCQLLCDVCSMTPIPWHRSQDQKSLRIVPATKLRIVQTTIQSYAGLSE